MREGSSHKPFPSIAPELTQRPSLLRTDASLVAATGFEIVAESCHVNLQDMRLLLDIERHSAALREARSPAAIDSAENNACQAGFEKEGRRDAEHRMKSS